MSRKADSRKGTGLDMKKQNKLGIKNYHSKSGFIFRYQKLIKEVVLPYQWEILNDRVPGAEKSHVVANFINAGKVLRGEDPGDGFYGMVFQDSDAAKWIEAAAYSLEIFPDQELEKTVDGLIELIEQAQDEDGYLNTYYTIKDKEKRWTNLLEGHELYCAGHMMEAAVAYYEATGKDKLLKVMQRNAAHIYRHFVEQGNPGYPGHPEIELALLKLYQAAEDEKCLLLAQHFIDVRGVDPYYFEKEVKSRDWQVWGNDAKDHDYQQSARPVREQSDATGHSVRAVYLYTGMAQLAARTGDEELKSACKRLWESITNRRMYLTGGIGSTVQGEAFTVDYDLPNDTAYAETCASIGLMFFASGMLELEPDSRYSDMMERAFYNTVLAGMQLDGKKFFYVNPLEVIPGISGEAVTHRHALPERPGWYACACCPPNVARLIASFGTYAYGENEDTAFCHLFAEGDVSFQNGMEINCRTGYPYEFQITYRIEKGQGELAVRIPEWSSETGFTHNGKQAAYTVKAGYAYLKVSEGDVITVTLEDQVHRMFASSKVAENTGCAALQRGPLVYCFEGVDNEEHVLSLFLSKEGEGKPGPYNENLLNGTTQIKIRGWKQQETDALYTRERPCLSETELTAVPYYTWGNRGINQMRVWLPEY